MLAPLGGPDSPRTRTVAVTDARQVGVFETDEHSMSEPCEAGGVPCLRIGEFESGM
jgi:hypothetical protein